MWNVANDPSQSRFGEYIRYVRYFRNEHSASFIESGSAYRRIVFSFVQARQKDGARAAGKSKKDRTGKQRTQRGSEKTERQYRGGIDRGEKGSRGYTRKGRARSQSKADDIIGEAKIKAKGLVERTEKELDEERKKLQQDIEKEITDVSFVVAEKVLARDITKEDNKRMIEECLEEWSKK